MENIEKAEYMELNFMGKRATLHSVGLSIKELMKKWMLNFVAN